MDLIVTIVINWPFLNAISPPLEAELFNASGELHSPESSNVSLVIII